MNKLSPIGKRVVALPKKPETKTGTGLYLPDTAADAPSVATVESVGPDVKGVKVGDEIVYKEYSVTEVKLDRSDYLIINEEDILAKV